MAASLPVFYPWRPKAPPIIVVIGRGKPECKQGGRMKHNRRGFLRMLLAAPLAVVTAAGLYKPGPTWTPLNVKYTKVMGTMEIMPEVYEKVFYQGARGGGKTEFQRLLQQTLEAHRREINRFYGYHQVAMGDDEFGVR